MQKECKYHGFTDHRKEGKKTVRWRCKKCATEAVQRRRWIVKEKSIEYKGGKCCKCGYDKCNAALEFHHLDPSEKDFNLAKKGNTYSWEKIKKEIDKCILVCSNCHREIHDSEYIEKKQEFLKTKELIDKNIQDSKLKNIQCKSCDKTFFPKHRNQKFCSKQCTKKIKDRPSKELLLKEVQETSYCAVGRKYGVSDNCIRKWLK